MDIDELRKAINEAALVAAIKKDEPIGSAVARSINEEALVLQDMARDVEDVLARLAL